MFPFFNGTIYVNFKVSLVDLVVFGHASKHETRFFWQSDNFGQDHFISKVVDLLVFLTWCASKHFVLIQLEMIFRFIWYYSWGNYSCLCIWSDYLRNRHLSDERIWYLWFWRWRYDFNIILVLNFDHLVSLNTILLWRWLFLGRKCFFLLDLSDWFFTRW